MFFLSVNHLKQGAEDADFANTISKHIAWTHEQIAAGKIAQAGKWGDTGGMAIVSAESLAEAEELLAQDPLAKAGLVVYETARLYPDVPIG